MNLGQETKNVQTVTDVTEAQQGDDRDDSCTGNSFLIGDLVCDDVANTEMCLFDGGDCCLQNIDTSLCLDCTCKLQGKIEMFSLLTHADK